MSQITDGGSRPTEMRQWDIQPRGMKRPYSLERRIPIAPLPGQFHIHGRRFNANRLAPHFLSHPTRRARANKRIENDSTFRASERNESMRANISLAYFMLEVFQPETSISPSLLQPANMRSQLVTRETSQEETSAADSNRQQKNIPAMSVTLEVSQLEHSIEASAEQPAKLQKKMSATMHGNQQSSW